jgi:hypothetical protein
MTAELLACPFCGCHGVVAAYPRIIRDKLCGTVECFTDNCYALIIADTEVQAVTAWNRRVPYAALLAKLDRKEEPKP